MTNYGGPTFNQGMPQNQSTPQNLANYQNPPLPQANIGFSGGLKNRVRWDDSIPWFPIPDRQVVTLRFIGPIHLVYYHWCKTKTGKRFPLLCSAYEPESQTFLGSKCPIDDDFNIPSIVDKAKMLNPAFDDENDTTMKEIKAIKARMTGLGHAIVRRSQTVDDPSQLKPFHPIKIPASIYYPLMRLKSMNRCTVQGKEYEADVADNYWGRDIHILYDANNKNPQQKYTVQLGNHTPLNEMELTYLKQLYNWSQIIEYPTYEEVKQALQSNGYYQYLNSLTSVGFQDNRSGQQAYMEQYLPQPPRSPYQQQQTPNFNQMQVPQQQQVLSFNQQQQVANQQPVPSFNQQPVPMPSMGGVGQMPTNYYQDKDIDPVELANMVPQQSMQQMQQMQQHIPQAPSQMGFPQMQQQPIPVPHQYQGQAQAPNMNGLSPAMNIQPSPIPANVAPPLGSSSDQGDFDIPFDQAPQSKVYIVKGKPNGVTAAEFQKIVQDFSTNLERSKPLQTCASGDLENLQVLACYGNYAGDINCVKCPLRNYCLHV